MLGVGATEGVLASQLGGAWAGSLAAPVLGGDAYAYAWLSRCTRGGALPAAGVDRWETALARLHQTTGTAALPGLEHAAQPKSGR